MQTPEFLAFQEECRERALEILETRAEEKPHSMPKFRKGDVVNVRAEVVWSDKDDVNSVHVRIADDPAMVTVPADCVTALANTKPGEQK